MISRNDIKQRMNSIDQTRQITKAMHLLSATKVKRDAGWVELTRTYFRRVRSTIKSILENSKGIEHRYMQESRGNRAAFVVIAGDKGLAGGYNHNVLSYALKTIAAANCTHLIAVGQVTKAFFQSKGYTVNTDFLHAGQRPYLRFARRMVNHMFEMYDNDQIDEFYIIYTRYDSALSQFPQMVKLLPVEITDYKNFDLEYAFEADMIYEPSPQEVFDILVPEFATGLLFGCMVQSYISEHTARMNAMDSATGNVDDMLEDLSLEYNLARQYAITAEIAEIVGAASALAQELEER